MKKLFTLAIFFTGYVLGSKAGKGRYEQIKKYSNKVYKAPVVSKTIDKVSKKTETFVKNQGEKITDKVAEVVKNNLFTVKVTKPESKNNQSATNEETTTNTNSNYSTIDTTNLPDSK
ncbi:YtxH domain-containing protein [Actinomyces sp. zg-332]|uniref:YtxH domain-containing protein n=1 Tax=Actinomyces sp. zg-332 TaxID=2708340 RepID=UPI001423ACF1|nr:YtxH domain-containing protein [Actinomyces sp. zg-332]QPK94080.1 YtxH domain-containing protein [Actinomyces sp. zg-332]